MGTGLGKFDFVFRFYRTDATDWVVEKAHGDYLEVALELGLPAVLALITALAALGNTCVVGAIRRTRDLALRCTGLAAWNFSLQNPVCLVWCITLSAAASQSVNSRD